MDNMEDAMFWDEKIETMPRDEMTGLQGMLLTKQVKLAYEKNSFYRDKFDRAGLSPEDIKSTEDLHRIPFTEKNDLRDHYPYAFLAVPTSELARLHASSGTTGKPTPVFHTRKDLDNWAECMARNCTMAGVRKGDVSQISFKYTLFTGAFGHHLGAERIGSMVIPISSGQTEKQLMMMRDFRATVLHCTPSYAIVIAEKLAELGIKKESLSLRVGIHGAEPMTEELRAEIESRLGITAIGDYGLTELGGPGVSIECPEKKGYHINEDFFLPEIIDPETNRPVPIGEDGELVFTTLQKEAMPVIRYRTKDITCLEKGICNCGRTLIRHAPIKGRTDDMIIIGGVNFFPSQLESMLLEFKEVEPQYIINLVKKGRLDHISVNIERCQAFQPGDGGKELKSIMEGRIKDLLGFKIDINIVEPMTLPRTEGKSKRIADKR
jgi:phenylacetate-CoA ligase